MSSTSVAFSASSLISAKFWPEVSYSFRKFPSCLLVSLFATLNCWPKFDLKLKSYGMTLFVAPDLICQLAH